MIAVTNFDGETLRRMLDFMYEGKYDVSRPEKHEESKYESYSESGIAFPPAEKIVSLLTPDI